MSKKFIDNDEVYDNLTDEAIEYICHDVRRIIDLCDQFRSLKDKPYQNPQQKFLKYDDGLRCIKNSLSSLYYNISGENYE